MNLIIHSNLIIPWSEIELTYVRSSGPGGQNVNKVNSKACLRWNLIRSSSLSDAVKQKLLDRLKNQLTQSGDILVFSDQYRDQIRNRNACYQKFVHLIQKSLIDPTPRKKTKPTRSSKKKRVESKRLDSAKKKLRRFKGED